MEQKLSPEEQDILRRAITELGEDWITYTVTPKPPFTAEALSVKGLGTIGTAWLADVGSLTIIVEAYLQTDDGGYLIDDPALIEVLRTRLESERARAEVARHDRLFDTFRLLAAAIATNADEKEPNHA